MKKSFIKSTIFNLSFYVITLIACLICLPTLFLPRRYFLRIVHLWILSLTALEKTILGLTYELRGLENLPKNGSFIVAAKHQSPYETFKLRLILNDPAVILKEELLRIPLWGAYLKKSDVIAIDRSSPKKALASIKTGAMRVKTQGRPIVIFPQGTRTWPHETPHDKPYKSGIYNIQKATELPIIPLALNSGIFWPRTGWLKGGGCVIFEFLPPLEYGQSKTEIMTQLEQVIEEKTNTLMKEAPMDAEQAKEPQTNVTLNENENEDQGKKKNPLLVLFILALIPLILFGVYSYAWFATAQGLSAAYINELKAINGVEATYTEPQISGFPRAITLFVPSQTFKDTGSSLTIENLKATGWPFPSSPVDISSDSITINNIKWKAPLRFDAMNASLSFRENVIIIEESALTRGAFAARAQGSIDTAQSPLPKLDILVVLENHSAFLNILANDGIIKRQAALFIGAGLLSFVDENGQIKVPIHQKEQKLYVGPFAILEFPLPKEKTR